MSNSLAGPLPWDPRNLQERIVSLEIGGRLRQAGGPVVTSIEMLKPLPRRLRGSIPNNFNPCPGAGTKAAIKKSTALIQEAKRRGGKFLYGE